MGMAYIASQKLERDALKLSLAILLRPPETTENLEMASLVRRERDQAEIDKRAKEPSSKIGETKTVPVTFSATSMNVEGIGPVSEVRYGIITYETTKDGVKAENRAVWGGTVSGFITFNE